MLLVSTMSSVSGRVNPLEFGCNKNGRLLVVKELKSNLLGLPAIKALNQAETRQRSIARMESCITACSPYTLQHMYTKARANDRKT